ncbi:hypothetical protein PAHAL_3G212500 [Panicum hallii]|uniref:Uncharacterized protein n=1 Tax=Panicum hallii TaxID=206008 RepID=A0A2S3HAE6_9POAL|nr:hypothetical protein PAHAL_3G212500 [Panicum hallii]
MPKQLAETDAMRRIPAQNGLCGGAPPARGPPSGRCFRVNAGNRRGLGRRRLPLSSRKMFAVMTCILAVPSSRSFANPVCSAAGDRRSFAAASIGSPGRRTKGE